VYHLVVDFDHTLSAPDGLDRASSLHPLMSALPMRMVSQL